MRHSIFTIGMAILLLAPAGTAAADEPFVVTALGDSLSAGFNARRIGDNRNLSWATGDSEEVMSHYLRIQKDMDREVIAFNEAIVGSMGYHLERQTNRALGRTPDYVTITVGANDVCTWGRSYERDLEDFKGHVKAAIDRLVASNDRIKIYLAPIPDIVRLKDVARDRRGCQLRWNFMNICTPLLGAAVSSDDEEAFAIRLAAANDALEEVAASDPHHVLFDMDLAQTNFEWEHISPLDCFHPNVSGQHLFAETTWEHFAALILSSDSL